MTEAATPHAAQAPYGIHSIALPDGLAISSIREYLRALPDQIGTMQQRDITSAADSATAVYLANDSSSYPDFGLVVVIKVDPDIDAEKNVESIATTRWGNAELHTITGQSARPAPTVSASENRSAADIVATPSGPPVIAVAYREFSRTFPPGQFAIPNQPVYFLIWYRPEDEYAYMVIGHSVQAREEIVLALVTTFGNGE